MEAQNGFLIHFWTEIRQKSTKSSYSTIKLAFCGAQKMTKKKGKSLKKRKLKKITLPRLKTSDFSNFPRKRGVTRDRTHDLRTESPTLDALDR